MKVIVLLAILCSGCIPAMILGKELHTPTYEELNDQAIDDCNDEVPGVPDKCERGDKECQSKVHAFNQCVKNRIHDLSPITAGK